MKKKIGMLLAVLLCAAALATAAHALALPDLDREGEITITVRDEDDDPMRGVELTLYRVAALKIEDGELVFDAEPGLSRFEEDMNGKLTASASGRLARRLAASGALKNLWSETQKTDKKGQVCYEDLKMGMYLVVQTGGGKGYEELDPFLVILPVEEDGAWSYVISANPKTEPEKPDKPDKPDKPEKPEKPEEPDEPEEPEIPEEPETPEVPEEPTGPKLPQTGMLRWPVFVLAVGGMLLFSLGWVLDRKEKKDEK